MGKSFSFYYVWRLYLTKALLAWRNSLQLEQEGEVGRGEARSWVRPPHRQEDQASKDKYHPAWQLASGEARIGT